MLKKNALLLGMSLAIVLLLIATINYPGGSQNDPHSVGFDWAHNYLSNLFGSQSVNGMDNSSRGWAIVGMLVLSLSLGRFFIQFSDKLKPKSGASVIKYSGCGAMVFAFLSVSPLHDLAIVIGTTLALVCCFYITLFIFKSKLHFLKILSILYLLIAYGCNYIYFTGQYLEWLPIVQKITFLMIIIWVLSLEYFTRKEDFESA